MKYIPSTVPVTLVAACFFIVGVFAGYVINPSKQQSPDSSPYVSSITSEIESPSPTPACATHSELTHDNLSIKFNEERLKVGLNQLFSDDLLEDYALIRAKEIAANGSYEANNPHQTKYKDVFYWAHTKGRSTEGNRFASYSEEVVGHREDSCSVIEGFMSSPTHREGIIDPKATDLGIGVFKGYVVYEIGVAR